MEPLPWLDSKFWIERTETLPGMLDDSWASLEPSMPFNNEVAELHDMVLKLSHDDTDLNIPF